jgi:hypothetical protein
MNTVCSCDELLHAVCGAGVPKCCMLSFFHISKYFWCSLMFFCLLGFQSQFEFILVVFLVYSSCSGKRLLSLSFEEFGKL